MAQTKTGAMKAAAKMAGIEYSEYIALRNAGNKRCGKCHEWKPMADFDNDASRRDGKCSQCKPCRRVKNPYACAKGRPSTFKGKKHSPEAIEKIKKAAAGRPSPMAGKNHTLESRKKISQSRRNGDIPRGSKCHTYIDGKGTERQSDRLSAKAKRWRYDVFTRDEFTCQHCGDDRGGNLNAHHIKPWALFPKLRYDLDNGITLCEPCHKAEHKRMRECGH